MNDKLHLALLEATRLTRAGRLREATALLQVALRGKRAPDPACGSSGTSDQPAGRVRPIIDVVTSQPAGPAEGTARPHMPEVLRGFLDRLKRIGSQLGIGGLAKPLPAPAPEVLPEGGGFVAGSYSNEAGSRAYKLYVPSSYGGQTLPLIVMLHGCTQSPDDFAAGTRMNAIGEKHTCLVAYPAQTVSANPSKCWNWFRSSDQQRGQGEPSLIAGITRQIMRNYSVDAQRVYVAGLSAGAAAAAIMGATYPDLYAAVGVHSGLACGAASDLPSAFAAMREGEAASARLSGSVPGAGGWRRIVPTIVFHGDQDTTVHPRNGDQVIAQSKATPTVDLQARLQRGQVPGGHTYSRTLHADVRGQTILEHWVIHGAGHAWSGGSPAGSYTDPRGPDAAREMLRFFLEHPHPTAVQLI